MGDSRLSRLTELARRMPHQESARRDAASFASFEVALLRRSQNRSRAHRWGAGVALTASLLLLLGIYSLPAPREASSEPALRYAVEPAAGDSERAQRFSFSDGSTVELADQSALHIAEVDAHGARVVLSEGSAEVSIAKRKHAAWQFEAGPYTVRVTGTAFQLRWSEKRAELMVAMHHGSVVVTGPLSPQGTALHAGQRLIAEDRTRRLRVEDAASARADALAPIEIHASRSRDAAALRGKTSRAAGAHDWDKRVAQGDFKGVLRAAEALGYARALTTLGASDLTAVADAARYLRKTQLGRDALLALRERFPESALGRHAAFFLGRMSDGDRALSWYERYLQEQPRGEYAAQALGRSMMLYYERGDTERAGALAARYLGRFPLGPYAASARTLLKPARVQSTTP